MEGCKMLKTWRINYFYYGDLTRAVVIAETKEEAISFVVDGVVVLSVEKCYEVTNKGRVLTLYQD
jgi:hypothetical protein